MPRASATDPATVTRDLLRGWPLPEPSGGKEDRGRVLVVGGTAETPGGVLLAAEAALRAGAGKLQVATARSVAPAVAVALPEAMVRGLPEMSAGAINPAAADQLLDLVERADCVLLGPGFSDPEASAALVLELADGLPARVVVDALALAAVTEQPDSLRRCAQAVLTPNPGELARALGAPPDAVADDPAGCARALAERTSSVVSLGGATSWTAAPSGDLWRDAGGSAGLGVSGSGDVRAGLVAGLLARGCDPAQAAVWGAFVHGLAGERLAATVGPFGFLARELPGQVPGLLAEIAR
jgi:hydroxyethylthiazole kinase-like uncharacterized protein yjeF